MLWHEHMSRRNIDNSEALQVCYACTLQYLAPTLLQSPCDPALLLLILFDRTMDNGPRTAIMMANAPAPVAGASSEAFLDLQPSQTRSAPERLPKNKNFMKRM